jgi:hypothetical protein
MGMTMYDKPPFILSTTWLKYALSGLCYLGCLYLAIALWWYKPGEVSYFDALIAFTSPASAQDYFIIGVVIAYSFYAGAVLMLLLNAAKYRSKMSRVLIYALLVGLALWAHIWGVIYWKQTPAASIWLYLLVLPILSSTLLALLALVDLFFPQARARKS